MHAIWLDLSPRLSGMHVFYKKKTKPCTLSERELENNLAIENCLLLLCYFGFVPLGEVEGNLMPTNNLLWILL